MLTGFAIGADEFGRRDKQFADNVRNYHRFAREGDLCMTHTLLNPQVDRSKPVEAQDKDLAARIVKETDSGIVIKGARMVATLCAFSDDILVMPSTFLATNDAAAPYAFGFSIPVAAPGLRFVCRPAVAPLGAGSAMDYPLSSRLDEGDALAVFDDVLVPQVMHQTSTKNLAKTEFMMALGFALARSTNIDSHLHVQGMLAELIQHTEFVRACLRASEADAETRPDGVVVPATMPLWTVRMMFPKMFVRACEIIQTLGAGGLVMVPSYAEIAGPVSDDIRTYAQAATVDAATRIKLFRLAFDAAMSSFSGRQQLYERYYSGDPVRLAGALYAMVEKDSHVERIHAMLDTLEARQAPAGAAPAFLRRMPGGAS
jgi:4-hydroxyphenylacetate 3-monooxygenase